LYAGEINVLGYKSLIKRYISYFSVLADLSGRLVIKKLPLHYLRLKLSLVYLVHLCYSQSRVSKDSLNIFRIVMTLELEKNGFSVGERGLN